MRSYRNYEEGLKVRLSDPVYAKEYLSIALEEYDADRNIEAFLLALQDVVNAQGGLSKLESQIKLSREEFHAIFTEKATLQFKTFEAMGAILHGLGFKFSIETLENSP